MKLVSLALMTLIGASAQAESLLTVLPIQKYEAAFAEIDPAHVAHPGKSTLDINYNTQTVTLKVEREWYCPPNAACALVMPEPLVVELPIVSVEEKECGIKEITAAVDQRPVDLNLVEIKVQDISQTTCMYFRQLQSEATYVTGGEFRGIGPKYATSRFSFNYLGDSSARRFQFAKGEFIQGFNGLEIPSSGTIAISEATVKMDIYLRVNCKPMQPCPRYMPAPIQVVLPIVKVEKSFCGDLIVAELIEVDGDVRKIELMDYSNVQCRRFFPHKIEADYTYETRTVHSQKPVVKKAKFNFN